MIFHEFPNMPPNIKEQANLAPVSLLLKSEDRNEKQPQAMSWRKEDK